MLNVFTHIKNNSTWLLDGEIIVVFKTSWIWDGTIIIYPIVYYYYLKDTKTLCFMTRAEFIMNAQKYNIKEKCK
jgi:hypothetical protein